MTSEIISFELFGTTVSIYYYGVFLLIAVIAGIFILYRELSRRNLETKRILDNIFWILLFGIIGARIGYVLTHLDFYGSRPVEILKIWEGGLTFTGGLIFGLGVAAIWLYLKNRKEMFSWLDSAIVAVMLGHAIGMLGSFTSGLDYGKETSLPWGIENKILSDGILRHPTQLYEFIAYLVCFIILLLISHRVVNKKDSNIFPGFIFFLGLSMTFLIRFLVEFFRVSDNILFNVGVYNITVTHIISLVFLMISLTLLIYKERKYLKIK